MKSAPITTHARSRDPEWSLDAFSEKLRPILLAPYPAPSEFWVLRSGESVATVGAVVSMTHPERGYVGFFQVTPESNRELARAALEAAVQWLRERGCKTAYGPLNLSTWFTYRYKLPSSDPHLFWFEPTAPDSYREAFKAAGFVDDSLYLSEAIESYATLEAYVKPVYERVIAQGYRIEALDPAVFVSDVLPKLYPICMQAFSENYLFEPISEKGFLALYGGLAQAIDLRHSQLLRNPEGAIIGFSLWFIEKRHLIFKTVAVDPKYRGKGLSNAMVWPAIQSAKAHVDHFAGVLFKADNISSSYSKHGKLLWRHEYMLYRCDL